MVEGHLDQMAHRSELAFRHKETGFQDFTVLQVLMWMKKKRLPHFWTLTTYAKIFLECIIYMNRLNHLCVYKKQNSLQRTYSCSLRSNTEMVLWYLMVVLLPLALSGSTCARHDEIRRFVVLKIKLFWSAMLNPVTETLRLVVLKWWIAGHNCTILQFLWNGSHRNHSGSFTATMI